MAGEIAETQPGLGGPWRVPSTGNAGALVAKEVRLLLPAYGAALLLAMVPELTIPKDAGIPPLAQFSFLFGLLLVALCSFGREFNLRTFPSLLAQPAERNRIWWTKVGVLAVALGTLFVASWLGFWLTCEPGAYEWTFNLAAGAVIFAGGLWTTLLTRQVTTAFWFSILIPVGISLFVPWNIVNYAALGLYAVGGFLLAWRLFLRAQEVGWVGGSVSLPGWLSSARTGAVIRVRRPWSALFWKEIQLHQVSIIGIGVLFVLHLAVIFVRQHWHDSLNDTVRVGLEVFAGIWALVPLVIAGSSVAEERRLGTLAGNLCLPVSARAQYCIKLLVAVFLVGLATTILPGTLEYFSADGARAHGWELIWAFFLLFLAVSGFSLLCFYASTLSGSLIQAIAAVVLTVITLFLLGVIATMIGLVFWEGILFQLVVWPCLVAAVVWLGSRNIRCVVEGWQLWGRNLCGFLVVFLVAGGVTAAVYHRVWELAMPLEAPHGPLRLGSAEISSTPSMPSATSVVLADGRLFNDFIGFDRTTASGIWGAINPKNTIRSRASHFDLGSNWVDGAITIQNLVAIRGDGTLWVASRTLAMIDSKTRMFSASVPGDLTQCGDDTNWSSVVNDGGDVSRVVLLKRDGTLWLWDVPHVPMSPSETWRRDQAAGWGPQLLETGTNWARILSVGGWTFLWAKDANGGVAYSIPPTGRNSRAMNIMGPPDFMSTLRRTPELDGLIGCKSIVPSWREFVVVREDGSLWQWRFYSVNPIRMSQPAQIGRDTNWVAVTGDGETLVALKADGSLWKWLALQPQREFRTDSQFPVRMGTHNDWIAVTTLRNEIVSLAADGSLWHWFNPSPEYTSPLSELLAPPRRPERMDGILDAAR